MKQGNFYKEEQLSIEKDNKSKKSNLEKSTLVFAVSQTSMKPIKKDVIDEYKSMGEKLSDLDTKRGGCSPERLKGFCAEQVNSAKNNVERIENNVKAREIVIDDNGKWDSVVKYSNGQSGRLIQDKCGYKYSDYKKMLENGIYDGGVLRINSDNPIFKNEKQFSELKRLAKEHNVKFEVAKTTAKEMNSLAQFMSMEGKINTEDKAPLTSKVYSEINVAKYVIEKDAKVALEGGKAALVNETPRLVNSAAKKMMNVKNGKLSLEEAAGEIVTETGSVYISGAVIGVINEHIDSVANEVSKKILKKSIPAGEVGRIAGAILALKDCTERYANGEIDSGEYFIELFEDGMGYVLNIMVNMGNIGNPLGAAICSYLCSEAYNTLVQSFREVRFSAKKLKEIELVKAHIIEKERGFQVQLQGYKLTVYNERERAFDNFNIEVYKSILNNDIDAFIQNINGLCNVLGTNVQFETFEEFDEFMSDDNQVFVL